MGLVVFEPTPAGNADTFDHFPPAATPRSVKPTLGSVIKILAPRIDNPGLAVENMDEDAELE